MTLSLSSAIFGFLKTDWGIESKNNFSPEFLKYIYYKIKKKMKREFLDQPISDFTDVVLHGQGPPSMLFELKRSSKGHLIISRSLFFQKMKQNS